MSQSVEPLQYNIYIYTTIIYIYITTYLYIYIYVRRSKHGTDSMVISLGGIAPQGSLSLHTVGAHFWPKRRWII